MPALSPDNYDALVGKFVVTQYGQMFVEQIEYASMTAIGSVASLGLTSLGRVGIPLETILDSEVTEVDWRDPEVVEKFLAGEQIVDDVRLVIPPAAEPLMCDCACGKDGGCYRLGQGLELLAGHHTIPAVGCYCDGTCRCQ